MTDQHIIDALIAHDDHITRHFFFEKCRPLFMSIINNLFDQKVDYDEFVNELYLDLMKDDAKKLRQFSGRSSIYQWLKTVAIRFFMRRRDELTRDCLLNTQSLSYKETVSDNDSTSATTARMDIERLLSLIDNKRYALVIRRLIIEDSAPNRLAEELGITVDNLYNIKKRAITALTQVALNDINHYGN